MKSHSVAWYQNDVDTSWSFIKFVIDDTAMSGADASAADVDGDNLDDLSASVWDSNVPATGTAVGLQRT